MLLNLVHRHDQRTQLFRREILDFVDENPNSDLAFLCGFRDGEEEGGEINFQVATVSGSIFRIDIQSKFHVVDGDFDRSHETLEDCETSPDFIAHSGYSI